MASYNDDPPDRGENVFRKSRLLCRSPPPPTTKRLFQETLSPSDYLTPEDRSKRVQMSAPIECTESPSVESAAAATADYCELVSEASTHLAKINEIVNDQGSRINISNKTSIMDMTQRITAIISLLAIKSSCNETKLANAQRDLLVKEASYKNKQQIGENKPSYADSLKLRLTKTAPAVEPRAPPAPCVIAYPTAERSADYVSSSATKQALMQAIKPSDDGFQIVGVKKTAKSGVVLRVTTEKQLQKLESVAAIKTAGLRLEKPKGRRPRLLIKDVPSALDDTAFLTALYRQNIQDEMPIQEDDFIKGTRIVRRRAALYGRKWFGVEIDSAVRKHLLDTKDKLFIDWARCRFFDDVEIVRCSNCQQYGHVHKYCTEKTPTCAHCAGNHESNSCTNKDKSDFKPVCASCKRFKKPHDHRCGAPDCPTYKYRLEQLVLNTNY